MCHLYIHHSSISLFVTLCVFLYILGENCCSLYIPFPSIHKSVYGCNAKISLDVLIYFSFLILTFLLWYWYWEKHLLFIFDIVSRNTYCQISMFIQLVFIIFKWNSLSCFKIFLAFWCYFLNLKFIDWYLLTQDDDMSWYNNKLCS